MMYCSWRIKITNGQNNLKKLTSLLSFYIKSQYISLHFHALIKRRKKVFKVKSAFYFFIHISLAIVQMHFYAKWYYTPTKLSDIHISRQTSKSTCLVQPVRIGGQRFTIGGSNLVGNRLLSMNWHLCTFTLSESCNWKKNLFGNNGELSSIVMVYTNDSEDQHCVSRCHYSMDLRREGETT